MESYNNKPSTQPLKKLLLYHSAAILLLIVIKMSRNTHATLLNQSEKKTRTFFLLFMCVFQTPPFFKQLENL